MAAKTPFSTAGDGMYWFPCLLLTSTGNEMEFAPQWLVFVCLCECVRECVWVCVSVCLFGQQSVWVSEVVFCVGGLRFRARACSSTVVCVCVCVCAGVIVWPVEYKVRGCIFSRGWTLVTCVYFLPACTLCVCGCPCASLSTSSPRLQRTCRLLGHVKGSVSFEMFDTSELNLFNTLFWLI